MRMNFSDYRLLSEAFNSNIEVERNSDYEDAINRQLTNAKVAVAHTRAFTTTHLKRQNIHVVRIKSHQHNGYEYHIDNAGQHDPTISVDRKSMTHMMTIIRKDAGDKLKTGKRVIIQSIDSGLHKHYKNLADRLAKEHSKVATDVGMKKLTTVDLPAHTIVIEQNNISKIPFLHEDCKINALAHKMLTSDEYSVL